MSLDQQHCIPCQIGAPTLTPQEIKALTPKISPEWQVVENLPAGKAGKKLMRNFKFKDFNTAIAFINQVATIAETEGHHPNVHLTNWNKVQLELYTHKISGLHQNDFILASKIDSLLR